MAKQDLKNQAIKDNRTSFLFYYQWLKMLCMSMFKYEDLPEGCSAKFIEKNYFENGNVIFAKNKDYDIINLSLKGNYARNYYDEPIKFTGYAGDFEMDCNIDNSVLGYNNILNMPTLPICVYFAEKISRVDRVYDVNLLGIKTPLIFKCSDKEYLTIQNIINDIYSNVPILKTKDKLDIQSKIEVLETKVPYLLDKLRDEKLCVMSEFLTFIGIQNVNITKKERLVKDEATSNNQLTKMDLEMFLSAREEAVKNVNKKFGTSIKVKARQNIIEQMNSLLEKANNINVEEE